MSEIEALIDRYFAMWNETDAAERRDLIAQTWTDTALYVDPYFRGDGRDGIHTMVGSVHQSFPGLQVRRSGAIDAHNGRVRFPWELGPAVADGIDVGVIVDGRLDSIVGFIDRVPAMAEA